MPVSRVKFEPDAAQWRARLERRRAAGLSVDARRFRQQIGVGGASGADPVIMSGHQATLWHPGIAAKFMATVSLARRLGATPSWVVVDQDPQDCTVIRVPIVMDAGVGSGESRATLGVERVRIGPEKLGQDLASDHVPMAIAAMRSEVMNQSPTTRGASWASASVLPGLARAAEALTRNVRHAGHGEVAGAGAGARDCTLAEQHWLAARDLLTGAVPGLDEPAMVAVYASRLSDTDLFAMLLDRMVRDPLACASAYNAALAQCPGTGMTPMIVRPERDRIELPLWRVDPATGMRSRVYVSGAGAGMPISTQVAPRALMMSGLLRLAGCDLFVHGMGGGASGDEPGTGGYDRAAEAWFGAWLGQELAPSVMATADVTLDMGGFSPEPVRPGEVAHAAWKVHAAMHQPALLGHRSGQGLKQAMLALIAAQPAGSGRRRELYLHMHETLSRLREERGERLATVRRQAAEVRTRADLARVALARDWSIALYPAEDLADLAKKIEQAFDDAGGT
jgi:hypothetical protein